eukprot:1578014-Prymnesium_polylepis.1
MGAQNRQRVGPNAQIPKRKSIKRRRWTHAWRDGGGTPHGPRTWEGVQASESFEAQVRSGAKINDPKRADGSRKSAKAVAKAHESARRNCCPNGCESCESGRLLGGLKLRK